MTKELSTLYESPQSPRCMDPDQLLQDQSHDEKWRDRSAAFGLLLSVVDVDPKQQPAWIKIEEVHKFDPKINVTKLFAGSRYFDIGK